MNRQGKPITKGAALLLAAAAVALAPRASTADRGFSAQTFECAPGQDAFLTVESARLPDEDFSWRTGGLVGYANAPLLVRSCRDGGDGTCADWGGERSALISHLVDVQLTLSLSFRGVFEAGLAVPFVTFQDGESLAQTGDLPSVPGPSAHLGPGDVRLHLKLDVTSLFGAKGPLGVAVVPVVHFPVGQAVRPGSFIGHEGVVFHPKLAVTLTLEKLRLGLDAGYVLRKTERFYLSEVGSRMTYGGAVEAIFTERVSAVFEVFGQNGLDGQSSESPLEADLGPKIRLSSGLGITAGAGFGILGGVGTPAFRAFAGVDWQTPKRRDSDGDGILDKLDECPLEREDPDGFQDRDGCEEPDNDQDLVLDLDDKCPLQPEDRDGFQDEDGCLDADNDEDGIPDTVDSCRLELEDQDTFEDADGCPDPDNDKDGTPDVKDTCPLEPEDQDAFEDEDGCPDIDNDKDSIPDAIDKCPLEPENFNAIEDDDGCPDIGKELVVLESDRIRINDVIQFKTNSDQIIGDTSFLILNGVVSIMTSKKALRVRVEGHTDSKGKRDHNLDLSKRRAASVKRYLVEHGIDATRLETEGFGPDKPIADNTTKTGRQQNRRVELIVLSAAPVEAPAESQPTPPDAE